MSVIFKNDNVKLIRYSEKSIAFFTTEDWGKKHKETLKEFAKYNPNLKYKDKTKKGWIASIKNEKMLAYIKRKFKVSLKEESADESDKEAESSTEERA